MIEQQKRKYRNLGISDPPAESESVRDHVVKTVMGMMELIRHGGGEFVYPRTCLIVKKDTYFIV